MAEVMVDQIAPDDLQESPYLPTEMTENVRQHPNLECDTINESSNDDEASSDGNLPTETNNNLAALNSNIYDEEEAELLDILNQTGLHHKAVDSRIPIDPKRGKVSRDLLDHTMITTAEKQHRKFEGLNT